MKLFCAKCKAYPTSWASYVPDQKRPNVRVFRVMCHGEQTVVRRTVPNYREQPTGFQITVFGEDA